MEATRIRQYGKFRFSLTYDSLPNFHLRLNFQPIVDTFDLQGNFTLLHWQAKPRGLRRWGAFTNMQGNTYYKVFTRYVSTCSNTQGLQINELLIDAVPTAVIFFPNTNCEIENDIGLLNELA